MIRGLILGLACGAAVMAGCGEDEEEPAAPAATQTAAPAQTRTAVPAHTADCGLVAFTPNSDHGAFEIKATGTTCEKAKALATAADGQAGSFIAEGFECEGERDEDAALPSTSWTCTQDDARVTFVTS